MTTQNRLWARWASGVAVGSLYIATTACSATQEGTDERNEVTTSEESLSLLQPKHCETLTFSVTRVPEDPTIYHVVGTFCTRGLLVSRTLQVMLPPSTYNRSYWDFPYQDGKYSYVNLATAAGYATLTIDPLGTGDSDHPASPLVTIPANPWIMHQIITQVRAGQGTPNGYRARRVVLLGASLGASTSVQTATWYPGDVDGVVAQGFLHFFGPGLLNIADMVWPAIYDPKFATSGFDPGYLTTRPGQREASYYLPNADPNVVALDDSLKDTSSLDATWGLVAALGEVSSSVTAPVLTITGDHDVLFCGAATCSSSSPQIAGERAFYPNSRRVDSWVVPDAGHVVNLQKNAPVLSVATLAWITANVGW